MIEPLTVEIRAYGVRSFLSKLERIQSLIDSLWVPHDDYVGPPGDGQWSAG